MHGAWLFVFLLVGIALSQEQTISLHGMNSVEINSSVRNGAIGIGFDGSVAPGTILIRAIGKPVSISTDTNGSKRVINISDSNEEATSAAQKLTSAGMFSIFIGVLFAGHQSGRLACLLSIVLFAVYVASSTSATEITVLFSPNEDIHTLQAYSEGSILVANNLEEQFNKVECASEGSSKLGACGKLLCFMENSGDCFDTPADITIGVLFPESGDFQLLGESTFAALEIALEDFGANNPHIRLVVADTQSDAEVAKQKAKALYDQGVRTFIGPLQSAESISVLEWSQNLPDDTLFLSPVASASDLGQYENFFTLTTSNQELGHAFCGYLAQFITEELPVEVLVVYRESPDKIDKLNAFQSVCQEYSITVTELASFAPFALQSAADAQPILSELENSVSSDALQVALFITTGEIRYFLEGAVNFDKAKQIYWMGTEIGLNDDIISSPDALSTARAVGLTSVAFIGDHLGAGEDRSIFTEKLRARTGNAPLTAAFVYDSVVLLYSALTHQDNVNARVLRSTVPYESKYTFGLSGWLRISETWRLDGEYAIITVLPRNSLDLTWNIYQLVVLRSTLDDRYESSYRNTGGFVVSQEDTPFDISGCDSLDVYFYTASHELVHKTFSTQYAEDNTLWIPSYYNFTLTYNCGSSFTTLACGGTSEAMEVACTIFTPTRERNVPPAPCPWGPGESKCQAQYTVNNSKGPCLSGYMKDPAGACVPFGDPEEGAIEI